jgi:hypothetical protein
MTKKKKIFYSIISLLMVTLVLVVLRIVFCPERKDVESRKVTIPGETLEAISNQLEDKLLDIQALSEKLKNSRILLVGETHFKKEVIDYFLKLLEHLPDPHLVLNLELPDSVQDFIDGYMENGEERYLEELRKCRNCLPYEEIIRWAFKNKNRVKKVYAMDESRGRIRFMRVILCTDTRNKTMAGKIYETYEHFPNAKIIGYGGQMHMLKSGRYRYDTNNRTPAGNLVVTDMGIPAEEVRIVMLDGKGGFPLSPAWKDKTGAIEVKGELADIPFEYFWEYPIFRVKKVVELCHFFVNVGKLSPIKRDRR